MLTFCPARTPLISISILLLLFLRDSAFLHILICFFLWQSDGSKKCIPNYYGSNCTQFCEDKDNDKDGHYKCDKNGNKICFPYWYGDDCKTFCISKESEVASYTCDNNGNKVCTSNWYGENCNTYCQVDINSKYFCEFKINWKEDMFSRLV